MKAISMGEAGETLPEISHPPIRVGAALRKSEGKTVIAHISDLHFKSNTNSESGEWLALADDLSAQRVDLLAVTGDIIDASVRDSVFLPSGIRKAFRKAHSYLTEKLCGKLNVDPTEALIVVPGNHDCRIKGIFEKKVQAEVFHDLFREQFKNILLPRLRLCLFVFDSNLVDKGINLATGLVHENDLVDFASLVRQVSESPSCSEAWQSVTRLALLHHHPMPIAATEHRAGVTEREEFLLLRNAGLFMTEMVARRIDLVLHGHKHYPSFSKATFPINENREHTVTVVAAGSAGPGAKNHPRSYNLITIADNGEVTLERRIHEAATYSGVPYTLQTYEDARRHKFERFAKRANAQMKVGRLQRYDTIKSGSGDVHIVESYEHVRAYNDSVDGVKVKLYSESGFFCKPHCVSKTPNQRIAFVWNESQESRRSKSTGLMKFDPPLAQNPIVFTRTRTIRNGIHFSVRDRRDATNDPSASTESIYFRVKNAYDLLTLKAVFPQANFPGEITLEARDPDDKLDVSETTHAFSRVSLFPDDSSLFLVLEKPIPGYKYKIVWDLPANDPEDLEFDVIHSGFAKETIGRLLALKGSQHHPAKGNVSKSLKSLKDGIAGAKTLFAEPEDDLLLEIAIHCYDEQSGGLVCVAAISDSAIFPGSKIWETVIKSGRTVIGQSYRRRAHVCWSPKPESDDIEFWDYDEGHTAIFSCPMYYPLKTRNRVAVISVASRSNTSQLVALNDDENAIKSLSLHLITWFSKSLLPALGMKP